MLYLQIDKERDGPGDPAGNLGAEGLQSGALLPTDAHPVRPTKHDFRGE